MHEILIKQPKDLKNIYDGHVITSLDELKEIIQQVQLLKLSSSLQYHNLLTPTYKKLPDLKFNPIESGPVAAITQFIRYNNI